MEKPRLYLPSHLASGWEVEERPLDDACGVRGLIQGEVGPVDVTGPESVFSCLFF